MVQLNCAICTRIKLAPPNKALTTRLCGTVSASLVLPNGTGPDVSAHSGPEILSTSGLASGPYLYPCSARTPGLKRFVRSPEAGRAHDPGDLRHLCTALDGSADPSRPTDPD